VKGEVRAAIAGTVLAGMFAQAMLLASGVLAARMLGAEGRGYLALIALLAYLVAHVASAGTPLAVSYFVATGPRGAAGVVRTAFPLFLVQASLGLALHAVILVAVLRERPLDVQIAGLVSLGMVPALLAQQYGLAFLQGQEKFLHFNVVRIVPSALYAAALALLFFVGTRSVSGATAAWLATTVIAAAIPATLIRRFVRSTSSGGAPRSRRELLAFGGKSFLGSASPLETFRLDQAIVGFVLSPVALGVYVVALALTNFPRFVAQGFGLVAYPTVARAGTREARRNRMWSLFGVGVVACTIVVAALEATAHWIIPLAFGEEFEDAVPLARILLLGSLLLGFRRVLTDGARGAGLATAGTVAEVASWLMLVPALLLLTPRFGSTGVAWAVVVAAASALLVMCVAIVGVPARPPTAGARLEPANLLREGEVSGSADVSAIGREAP
jgi:O-antigen/teichoic acid export membrane protein